MGLGSRIYEINESSALNCTIEEISKEFHLPQKEIEIQIAILKHFELIKEQKEENKNYIVLFE